MPRQNWRNNVTKHAVIDNTDDMTISLQGKWQHLRNLVQQFTDQGWKVVSCEPDEEFRFSNVVLER